MFVEVERFNTCYDASLCWMDDHWQIVKQIYLHFADRKFEFFHVRAQIPEYKIGIHMRLRYNGVIVRAGKDRKARIWRLSDPALATLRAEGKAFIVHR